MHYEKYEKETIPVKYRRKYNLTEGATIAFKEINEGCS